MALSFVVSYTFSPSTTISSSQVNTNTSDVAAVFQGLEALTKSFSNLRVDTTPTTSTDVAIKSYVDKLNAYRRPVLQYGSATTVAVEAGLDGTAGNIPLLFRDGTLRTETSTTRTTFDITRNAVLTTSGAQSGLTGATSEANNTRYALYGVKITDSSTLWVTVGSTVIPTQANFATLNTAYGTNGWVYLGEIVNGDSASAQGDIVSFVMSGNRTIFKNAAVGGVDTFYGVIMAATAGATSVTYTYAAGTGNAQIPAHLTEVTYLGASNAGSSVTTLSNAAGTHQFWQVIGTARAFAPVEAAAVEGLRVTNGSSVAMDVFWTGFVDGALGIGANPLL